MVYQGQVQCSSRHTAFESGHKIELQLDESYYLQQISLRRNGFQEHPGLLWRLKCMTHLHFWALWANFLRFLLKQGCQTGKAAEPTFLCYIKYMLVVTSSILSSTSSWSFSWIPVIVIGFNPTWGRGKHKMCRGLIGNENAWLGLNINYQLLLFLTDPTIVGTALDVLMCVFVFLCAFSQLNCLISLLLDEISFWNLLEIFLGCFCTSSK